jgi:predicted aspartyl protease
LIRVSWNNNHQTANKDHSNVILPIHEAVILWNGVEQKVRVLAAGKKPLLGTRLLENHELVVRFTEGGLVKIEKF